MPRWDRDYNPGAMNYWLLKSEPSVFGIDDLKRVKTSIWDGVRNYQARIHLRSAQPGDLAFFYHSNTELTGIAGLCKIIESGVDDPTQFDPKSDYYDPKSTPAAPRWQTVKVQYVETFPAVVTLDALKAAFSPEELLVVRKGVRLSVMPVAEAAAQRLLAMARTAAGL
jgi:predicted RNA-binding protein with PUA-like domain